ncbi:EYES ABSENT homolog [Striga hermonthica]|uniref:protein-tyrosine-phosphatase n=1 Tax=Striga hermonthica TaxID=68872 RepID=A0A9N7MED8_STRHE|nr:EYES ABSENT homolog [Striga hermonthica]
MDQKTNVYIWDMDETLILLRSLLSGAYAGSFNGLKDVDNGVKIGKLWENHILQVCDLHFFYNQIEHFNQPYLDVFNECDDGLDLSDYDFHKDGFGHPLDALNKRKLAYRHRVIAEKYRQGLRNILNDDALKLWDSLYDLSDTYTEKWFSSARACLEQCAGLKRDTSVSSNNARDEEFEHVNILVTSGPLVPSLVKCLFFRLDSMITCNNVYSSLEVGKLQCFTWIKDRFKGPHVQFCVIGDGWEECAAAESMKWPFVQIDLNPSSIHRFPGLTPADLGHYFSIVYGEEDGDEKTGHHDSID